MDPVMTQIIRVKAAPGRVAFSAPRGGRRIPEDAAIAIPLTPWVQSLIDNHGDVIVVGDEPAPEAPATKKAAHKAGN